MVAIACPSCGASVSFASTTTVYAVCPFCQSMLVRNGIDTSIIGKMASLPPDSSPFQIGTEGYSDKTRFGVIGRMRQAWTDGFWNEWFLLMDDGSKGWLVEAEGRYAVCQEIEDFDSKAILQASDAAVLPDSKMFTVQSHELRVVDVKKAHCVGSEGELPIRAPQGRVSISYDLIGENSEFASLEICEGIRRAVFGRYLDWSAMRCQNYRVFQGW
jgi:hypothetical protein